MEDFIAVVAWNGSNRITKFMDFNTQPEAAAHVAAHAGKYPAAFVAARPEQGGYRDWLVDGLAGTLGYDPPATVYPTVVSFDDFEARFTAAEWNAATDYVYATNTGTGLPLRRALLQGLARAQARGKVDLEAAATDAFLAALVSGGVLTAQRKAEILDPSILTPQ